jgi:hypothetical protein
MQFQKKYVVHRADGTPHFIEGHMLGLLEAVCWISPIRSAAMVVEKRAYLLDELGIDGFKTDGGEHIWDTKRSFPMGNREGQASTIIPCGMKVLIAVFLMSIVVD